MKTLGKTQEFCTVHSSGQGVRSSEGLFGRVRSSGHGFAQAKGKVGSSDPGSVRGSLERTGSSQDGWSELKGRSGELASVRGLLERIRVRSNELLQKAVRESFQASSSCLS